MAELYLVHHGDAVGAEIDPQRPLSPSGRKATERLAADAATRGAKPEAVWHSGKLRAKQTAEIFWRACNALAEFSATRDLQPDDGASFMRDRLRHEPRRLMLVGHFPHLPKLLALLLDRDTAAFPLHGIVTLSSEDEGASWREVWRIVEAKRAKG